MASKSFSGKSMGKIPPLTVGLSIPQLIQGDDGFLNVGRSLDDLDRLGIPIITGYRIFGGVAVSAENSHGEVRGLSGYFGGVIFGHGGFQHIDQESFILLDSSAVHQKAGG